MKILFDAMGGDNAPEANIRAAVTAINEVKADIVLIGKEQVINQKIKEIYNKNSVTEINERLKIVNAEEEITMEDTPTKAIKAKKDSSMVVGFNMLKNDEGDVFVSAGNSGALLAGATLIVGRIKGVDRPGLAGMLPAFESKFLLMDAGANTNCKPINILQFAQMAGIYLRNTYGIKKPKVGLLNNGTEESKGNDLMKESFVLLKENADKMGFEFYGNIEGRDAFSGVVDAVVTDGFTGNIFLKTTEGVGKMVKRNLKKEANKSIFSKISLIPALPIMKRFAKAMDYKEYGGAPFLGVKKPVVKAHGSSDEKLFVYTLKQAEQFAEAKSVDIITEEYRKMQAAEGSENAAEETIQTN
ncbi:MAG: phosphate acyltransferase PlsX [Clostridia bacterium]|nr:phosphate acyltransferase PlsX [Clostridia bacterium]